MLNKTEEKVLTYILSHELGISKRPFLKIAGALGMEEKEAIAILLKLQKKKAINKVRVVINHLKAGYKANALICWRVRPRAIKAIANVFIKNNQVSHCYERKPRKEFNYNIFTVMHTKEKKDIETFVRQVAENFSVEYAVLYTEKELKKERHGFPSLPWPHGLEPPPATTLAPATE